MDLSLSQLQEYIHYYAIQKNWKELEILLSNTTLNENELCILYWNAICCLKRGDILQSRNLFKQIDPNSNYNLASICGLVETYLITDQDDEEFDESQISRLKLNIKKLSKTDNVDRLMNTAIYFWHFGRLKQAKYYAEKGLNLNKDNINSMTICGWIYLNEKSSKYKKKAASYFGTALSILQKKKQNKNDELPLLAIYGLARCYQLKGKLSKSLACITQLIVHKQWFIDGLTLKSELQILIGQNKECIDTINRLNNNNIHCFVIKLCYFLMYNGNYKNILNHLQLIYKLFIQQYKLNKYSSYSTLFYNISNITSKFVIHSTEILEMCQKFISIAVELEPENAEYLTHQANLYLYLGYIQTATSLFRDAVSFDENNIESLCGAIYCRILKGEYSEANQELQFLTETMEINTNKLYIFLQAIISWKLQHDEDKFNVYIKSALEQYTNDLNSCCFSQYVDLCTHDPRFVVMVAREYLKHGPSEPLCSTDRPNNYLNECNILLDELCERIPGLGMIDAHLLHSKCKYLSGDIHSSECILSKLKDIDSNHWRSHLLQCQIALYLQSNNEAQACLDIVIGLNFQIQTTLLYHILKAKLLKSNGLCQEAITLLENTTDKIYSYFDIKNEGNGNRQILAQKKAILFSKYEENMDDEEFLNLCINVIIQLSQFYKITNEIEKGKDLMNTARCHFKGENEIIQIRFCEIRMLLKQGEIDAALASLHGISSSSTYYRRSRLLIADIYLKYKKNKKMYIECFQELCCENPNDIHCQLLLGDAYLNIQATCDAIHCYERALMISDYDIKLALKFGRALITSHDYQRAILHFEATLANNNNTNDNIDIKTELAELYIQFEQYDKAKILLTQSITKNSQTFHELCTNIKMLCLFADLYENVQRWDDAKCLLTESWSFQQKLLSITNASGKDIKPIEKMAGGICYKLGFVHLQLNNLLTAEDFLSKSIEFDIKNEKAMIEIAKLYAIKGNYQLAKEKLKSILSINQKNENAAILLANIYINHNNDLKTAITELRLFRRINPFNLRILLKLIKLLKKSGEFEKIKDLMQELEIESNAIGIHYIRGYVLWYIDNDNASAITELNKIRNDINWGPLALTLMIKIYLYLNPSFTFIDIVTKYSHSERHKQLEICQFLVKELKFFKPGHDPNILSIGCLLLIASDNENNLEKAHKTLNAICKKHPKHILSHLAFGCSLYLKNLPNKAIQFLNQFVSENQFIEQEHLHFDEYQQLLLILSQLKLNEIIGGDNNNNDDICTQEQLQLIQKMCLDLLKNDASCSKAWQICGIATEKQNNIVQACKHYGTAWKLNNEKNELLGYSLARSLLKLGRYIECIDIAHKVLDQNNDFEQIHPIIDHALSQLRS